ncbi:hypothetical protein R1flu_002774 [Riccia fluitans]|uniref:Fe2OG dioxygenase domain-containing protein n=1 Tax=Riccia fluitans TaxID=41844 RepID=A0ABD1Y817_9MARC
MAQVKTWSKDEVEDLILKVLSSTNGGRFSGPYLPPGSLNHLVKQYEEDGLAEIFSPVFSDLQQSVMRVSPLGPFQGPLKALVLLASFPPLAKVLVNHSSWHPQGQFVNARVLEVSSLLGPFFHISVIPDNPLFGSSDPIVGLQCFSDPENRSREDINSSSAIIRTVMHQLYTGLHELLLNILRVPETREPVLQYLADLVQKNVKGKAAQRNPFIRGSNGALVCLSAVMLRLCEPDALDESFFKKDEIDVGYMLRNFGPCSTCGLIKAETGQANYSLSCEFFVLTARVLNVGLLKALSDFSTLLRDVTIVKAALKFYRFMVVWLVSLVGDFNMPLPTSFPIEFASVQEHFIGDLLEMLLLASRIPGALDGFVLDKFMSFIVMFLESPLHVAHPYLREKVVEVLNSWIPSKMSYGVCSCQSKFLSCSMAALFEGHQMALRYLAPNLLKVYIDSEFTGSDIQFCKKFNIRRNALELLEYLRQVPSYHSSWKQYDELMRDRVFPSLEQSSQSFDICLARSKEAQTVLTFAPSPQEPLHVDMRWPRNGRYNRIIEPGLILLKGWLTIEHQVEIVRMCQQLGLGPGGFYQPQFNEQNKLHLRMMCLGMQWQPSVRSYQTRRTAFDNALAPPIPGFLLRAVDKSLRVAQALGDRGKSRTELIAQGSTLPHMVPDICVINFYEFSGKLGMHQDKDESQTSLRKGLPVVSFSIGDSGEFIYGRYNDPFTARKLVLDSGDVLIFGGPSRMLFHAVPKIINNTAPDALLGETNLRPGRLNLTFRQY